MYQCHLFCLYNWFQRVTLNARVCPVHIHILGWRLGKGFSQSSEVNMGPAAYLPALCSIHFTFIVGLCFTFLAFIYPFWPSFYLFGLHFTFMNSSSLSCPSPLASNFLWSKYGYPILCIYTDHDGTWKSGLPTWKSSELSPWDRLLLSLRPLRACWILPADNNEYWILHACG